MTTPPWLRRVDRANGPIYLALLRALEAAIAEGELQAGDQLPPQRAVAAELGVDFTTVTRAYTAARARGLVEGAVGRGTFVAGRAAEDEAGLVDLSMNLPPPPKGLSLGKLLKDAAQQVLARTDAQALMAYHPAGGSLGQRSAGATWLAPCLGEVDPARILVTPGAQPALTAMLGLLAQPGDAVICEPLTFPGMRALAAHLRLRLIPCPVDAQGLVPDALAELCAEAAPKAIYVIPTLRNPLATTMGPERRAAVAAVARAAGVAILEDDAYGRLPAAPLPAIASFAPELTWHVATTAKALAPGLRIAFAVAPDAARAQLLAQALRATTLMAAPLSAAIVTAWIRDGTADKVLAGVRAEAADRQAIARRILPGVRGAPEGIHLWLDLPGDRPAQRLHEAAQGRGLSLVGAEAFTVGPLLRDGLRLSLGGPSKQAVLEKALQAVADLLAGAPDRRLVV